MSGDAFSMFDELDKAMQEAEGTNGTAPDSSEPTVEKEEVHNGGASESKPPFGSDTIGGGVLTGHGEEAEASVAEDEELEGLAEIAETYPESTMPDVVSLEYENGDVQTIDTVAETNVTVAATPVTKVTPKKAAKAKKVVRVSGLYHALGLHSFQGQKITLADAFKRAVQVTAAKCDLTACMVEATQNKYSDVRMPAIVTIYNTHTGDILAPKGVGRDYGIVQYDEAVAFLERLMGGEYADLRYLAAPGTGSHLYVVLRAAGVIDFKGDEVMNDFLVTTSHDGSAKLNIRITPTIGKLTAIPFNKVVSFRHSKNVGEYIGRAAETIECVTEMWDTFDSDVRHMMNVPITNPQAIDYFKTIIGDDDESTRQTNIRDTMFSLFERGTIGRLAPGTMAAAYFAFVEWSNHHKTVRKMKHVKNGAEAELFGKFHGGSVKEQTEGYAFAVEMTNELADLAGIVRQDV